MVGISAFGARFSEKIVISASASHIQILIVLLCMWNRVYARSAETLGVDNIIRSAPWNLHLVYLSQRCTVSFFVAYSKVVTAVSAGSQVTQKIH
ncbi:hypothetical protein PoB_006479900 [Plakobranchus ocellatus]|uniref:NADH:ubiquinone reductase (H(+)-translocating) n=1 Tax=Plakobranchus ocellatus TaxID=259542 RepID=A0AAV4D2A0_9GAST|nr:hypothetical protein PoB_006479900 [Plakobranchus ocellatus]